jgi:hypothetical protein
MKFKRHDKVIIVSVRDQKNKQLIGKWGVVENGDYNKESHNVLISVPWHYGNLVFNPKNLRLYDPIKDRGKEIKYEF